MDAHLARQYKETTGNMRRAVLFLRRLSQKVVPVDTGNLKNSAFTNVEWHGPKIVGAVGYGAAYAVFVHERTIHYSRAGRGGGFVGKEIQHGKGTGAKFLEGPMKRNMRQIGRIIMGKE
jgi:hypothetical protein